MVEQIITGIVIFLFSISNSLNKSSNNKIGVSPLTLLKTSNSDSFKANIAIFICPCDPYKDKLLSLRWKEKSSRWGPINVLPYKISLSNELLKGNDIFNQNLSQYLINKYSKLYTGALSSLLESHIRTKFEEKLIQDKFSIEKINDDYYNTLNTLSNIYLQDKTDNLNEIINKLFGDDYKTIINIFDEIFKYIDKNENNKNFFNFNLNENLIEKYSDMKKQ